VTRKRIIRFALVAGLLLAVWWTFRSYETYKIPDGDSSLQSKYMPGMTVVARSVDDDDEITRGMDVVYAMEKDGVRYARFGRVRALAGDVVDVEDGKLTVNGEALVPPMPGQRLGTVPPGKLVILAVEPVKNRYPDSRALGFIPRSDVQGIIRFGW